MILTDIVTKAIIRGEKLSEEERITLLDFFMRAEKSTSNPVTGTISNPTQSDITAMVEAAIVASAKTFFPRVSDITNSLGLQSAGEFRVGNGQVPGDGFTGGRFGWPGFEYGSDTYFLVGVADDVLQVGLSLTDGKVYAGGGAVVLGATSSTIGGWTIDTYSLTANSGTVGMRSEIDPSYGGNDIRFFAGSTYDAGPPFRVTSNGTLVASLATITGAIIATSGKIGEWHIDSENIYNYVTGSKGIQLAALSQRISVGDQAGTYILIDGANQRIRSSNFVTGAAGFNIAADTGDAEFNNITARGELKTFLLTSSNQMAVAGNIIVSKDAGKLGADVTAIATTVNFGKSMTPGDWIKIQGPDSAGSNALEAMLVGSNVSGFTYNVTRNVDGSGANAWLKDTPFVVIGQSGDSRIELTAGASGSIQLITQGAAYGTTTVQASMSTVAGAITAGAGNVLLSSTGVVLANSATSWFNIKDSGGNVGTINIAADPNNDLEITNIATAGTAGTTSFFLKIGGTTRRVFHLSGTGTAFNESADNVDFRIGSDTNGSFFFLDASAETLTITGTFGVTGNASLDGAVVINEAGADKDFRVESDTNANFLFLDASAETLTINGTTSLDGAVLVNASKADMDFAINGDTQDDVFKVDAGLNRVEIGTTAEAVHIIDPTGITYFNEPGNDLDTIVRGSTDDNLTVWDAGLDAVGMGGAAESGYKLKVTGDLKVTGKIVGPITAETNSENIFNVASSGTSTFSGTINGTPSGTSVVYNAGFSGNENALVAGATTQLAKLRLYNTTRGTSALISTCNTGTNTITLTATAPAAWANGDTITIASQTVTGGTGNWVDLEITSGPTGKTSLFLNIQVSDTGTVANTTIARVHPLATFATSKVFAVPVQVSTFTAVGTSWLPMTSNVFTVSWIASSTNTMTLTIREMGYVN